MRYLREREDRDLEYDLTDLDLEKERLREYFPRDDGVLDLPLPLDEAGDLDRDAESPRLFFAAPVLPFLAGTVGEAAPLSFLPGEDAPEDDAVASFAIVYKLIRCQGRRACRLASPRMEKPHPEAAKITAGFTLYVVEGFVAGLAVERGPRGAQRSLNTRLSRHRNWMNLKNAGTGELLWEDKTWGSAVLTGQKEV
ncbi:hypothetical protein HK101_002350 [Irineochytrium annulatum]|nr:hypothetical protein HK101_002350 [Irineochytrium annulatum]